MSEFFSKKYLRYYATGGKFYIRLDIKSLILFNGLIIVIEFLNRFK